VLPGGPSKTVKPLDQSVRWFTFLLQLLDYSGHVFRWASGSDLTGVRKEGSNADGGENRTGGNMHPRRRDANQNSKPVHRCAGSVHGRIRKTKQTSPPM
jgi:hypothetical protein